MEENNFERIQSVWRDNNDFAAEPLKVNTIEPSQMAANIYCPGHSYMYVIDFARPDDFLYLSSGIKDALGFSPEQITLAQLYNSVHPKDALHMERSEKLIQEFIHEKIPTEDLPKYKFTYNVRFRHANGAPQLMLHQAMIYRQNEAGNPRQMLNVDTAIDNITTNNNYMLSVIGYCGAPSYLGIKVDGKTRIQTLPASEQLFTKRELEVICRFAEGLTAEEVAQALHISEGTVRSHRRNLLLKTECKNMTALVAKAIREGLI